MYLRKHFANYLAKEDCTVPEAWIIGTMAKGKWRRRMAERLNAEVILIKKPKQTCLKRAREDGDSQAKEWIENWFNNHDPDGVDRVIE